MNQQRMPHLAAFEICAYCDLRIKSHLRKGEAFICTLPDKQQTSVFHRRVLLRRFMACDAPSAPDAGGRNLSRSASVKAFNLVAYARLTYTMSTLYEVLRVVRQMSCWSFLTFLPCSCTYEKEICRHQCSRHCARVKLANAAWAWSQEQEGGCDDACAHTTATFDARLTC